mgnify:CR=1 FL=1
MPESTRNLFADDLNQRVEYASATVQYVGYASPGSLTSASVWQIRRLTYDDRRRLTTVEFADGNANRDNVWENRATLSYS